MCPVDFSVKHNVRGYYLDRSLFSFSANEGTKEEQGGAAAHDSTANLSKCTVPSCFKAWRTRIAPREGGEAEGALVEDQHFLRLDRGWVDEINA